MPAKSHFTQNADAPFFLYLTLTSPHTPIAVGKEWKGKSGLNEYADFVMQTDAVVGRVMEALRKSGAAENTLVFFTSDNGCSPHAEIQKLEAMGHFPSGPLRGYKFDAWEGGHRMPFIAQWPCIFAPGSVCDQLVQQTDLMATMADQLGVKLPDTACEDGVSLLPLLKGGTNPVGAAMPSAPAWPAFPPSAMAHGKSSSARGIRAARRIPSPASSTTSPRISEKLITSGTVNRNASQS